MYLSKFDKDDFLTTHCDSDDGIGIVINLTKEWEAIMEINDDFR